MRGSRERERSLSLSPSSFRSFLLTLLFLQTHLLLLLLLLLEVVEALLSLLLLLLVVEALLLVVLLLRRLLLLLVKLLPLLSLLSLGVQGPKKVRRHRRRQRSSSLESLRERRRRRGRRASLRRRRMVGGRMQKGAEPLPPVSRARRLGERREAPSFSSARGSASVVVAAAAAVARVLLPGGAPAAAAPASSLPAMASCSREASFRRVKRGTVAVLMLQLLLQREITASATERETATPRKKRCSRLLTGGERDCRRRRMGRWMRSRRCGARGGTRRTYVERE